MSTATCSRACASFAVELASERGVPAYVIFGDATLRELARLRPTNLDDFARVKGVGEKKLLDLGGGFIAHIKAYCEEHDGASA